MAQKTRNVCKSVHNELNRFAEETSIHGFTYLSRSHRLRSQIIWTAFLAVAFSAAAIMIGQNFEDTAAHPLSTTLDTVSVTQVPFPAITIHPGKFSSEKALFKRTFDYLHLERYNDGDELRNNTEFLKRWKNIFVEQSGEAKAWWIQSLLTKTKLTIKNDPAFSLKKGMVRNLAAVLAAAEKLDKLIAKSMEKNIEDAIVANLFKFKGFQNVNSNWVKRILEPIIEHAKKVNNITNQAINDCKKKACDKIRGEYELLLLIPLFLFMDEKRVVDIGAGHLLSIAAGQNNRFRHGLTNAINFGADGTLPDDIYDYALLFSDLYSSGINEAKANEIITKGRAHLKTYYKSNPRSLCNLELYTGFWYSYIYWNGTVVLKCPEHSQRVNCDNEEMSQVHDQTESIDCRKSDCTKNVSLSGPPCQDFALSEEYGFSTCCDFIQNVSRNRAAMLKVMKFTIQSPHLLESEEEEFSVFPNISQVFPAYKSRISSEETRRNFNPFIPLCQYSGEPEIMTFRSCNLFTRAYTDKGIGYSFNSEKFTTTFQETTDNVDGHLAMWFNNKREVEYPKSSGKDFQLRIVIDANIEEVERYEKNIDDVDKMPKAFLLTVHDPSSPANLRAEGIEVTPGYETTILITPRLLETSKDAKTMLNPKERKCKTKQETQGLKLFKTYTQEACLLECHLTEASDRCGCTPWTYPHIPGSLLCDALGIHCFERHLKLLNTQSTCDCPNDCDSVIYSFFGSAKVLEKNLLCIGEKAIKEADLFYDFYQYDALPKKFLAWYNYIVHKKEHREKELCKKKLKYRAVVNFQLATRAVSRTTQDLRQSFADKLSTFGNQLYWPAVIDIDSLGGTLGLFTGMSILSMVEMIFWIFR